MSGLTVSHFLERLEAGEILSDPQLAAARAGVSDLDQDAEAFVRQLVARGFLTAYQARELWRDGGRSLSLGNYIVEDEIGRGGMGVVLKAHHKRLQRTVAIKLLPTTLLQDNDAVARFRREVVAAARLVHPHIVTAFDADDVNGQCLLVMEYVDGSDLAGIVRKHGPLPPQRALDCIIQAARGLQFAHDQGVIHRDIKPANLLLDKQGHVKILDMGLARISDPGRVTEEAELTQTGTVMGTVDYMSPEQAMNTRSADARSDIYSLGITMFYLLTGRIPYPGDTLMARLMAHANAPIPALQDASPDIPPHLQLLFERMVAKKPEDRYQHMGDLLTDLQACLASPPGDGMRTPPASGQIRHDNELSLFLHSLNDELTGETKISSRAMSETELYTVPRAASGQTEVRGPTDASLSIETTPNRSRRRRGILRRPATIATLSLCSLLIIAIALRPAGTATLKIDNSAAGVTVSLPGTDYVLEEFKSSSFELRPGKQQLEIAAGDVRHTVWLHPPLSPGQAYQTRVTFKDGTIRVTHEAQLLATHPVAGTAFADSRGTRQPSGWQGWPRDAPRPAISPFSPRDARKHQEEWAAYLKVPAEFENSLGISFRLIPPGEFMMGSTGQEIAAALRVAGDDDRWKEKIRSEAPRHRVLLTRPFYLAATEVTQGQYREIMGDSPSEFGANWAQANGSSGSTESRPVERVTWYQAADFCSRLSAREQLPPIYVVSGESFTTQPGTGYRLPTEAEWEYACRAGSTSPYWCGIYDSDLTEAAWFSANSGLQTHEVATLKPNPFGLYDIHGNVWEWVEDSWDPTFYERFSDRTAVNPSRRLSTVSWRVVRDGNWRYTAAYCRAANRDAYDAHNPGTVGIGFRVAFPIQVPADGKASEP